MREDGDDRRDELIEALHGELRRFNAEGAMFSQVIAERLGIGATDLQVLNTLGAYGPTPAGRLAEVAGLASATMTGVIDRLERAGYVSRERDEHDRRRVLVTPRPQVWREVSPLFRDIRAATTHLCSKYDAAELAAIVDFVRESRPLLREHTRALRRKDESGD